MQPDFSPAVLESLQKRRRSRRILIGLQLITIVLIATGLYVRHCLTAFADHGVRINAQVIGATGHGGDALVDLTYVFGGQSYSWNCDPKYVENGIVPLLVRPEDPSRPYVGPELTSDQIAAETRMFFVGAAVVCLGLAGAAMLDTRRIHQLTTNRNRAIKNNADFSPRWIGYTIYGFALIVLWSLPFEAESKRIDDVIFGNNFLHLPAAWMACIVLTVVSIPFAVTLPASAELIFVGMQEGYGIGQITFFVFASKSLRRNDLRWNAMLTLGSVIYLVAITVAWTAYAMHMGV